MATIIVVDFRLPKFASHLPNLGREGEIVRRRWQAPARPVPSTKSVIDRILARCDE